MKAIPLKISAVFVLTLALLGCDGWQTQAKSYTATTKTMVLTTNRLAPATLWDRLASDFSFKTHSQNPRVQRFIKQFRREKDEQLVRISQQATPFLYYVVEELKARGMPPELALLPMIESEYKPTATSNKGASGLWQLQTATGRYHGIKQDQWYDGRKDINSATNAALGHLEYLYNKHDRDWLLTLAAYNAGSGRVSGAIRNNKRAGKPTDYWSLNLPQETQYFVPKFLALVYLIQNYRDLGIDLAPIANEAYFGTVKLSKPINLQQAATLAEIDFKEVKRLNSAYRTPVTHPNGPHQILLPVANVGTFHANMAATQIAQARKAEQAARQAVRQLPPKVSKAVSNKKPELIVAANMVHTVNRGDTLHVIASKYRTTVKSIMIKNKLTSDIIHSGQKLSI